MALINAVEYIGFGASYRGRDSFQQENHTKHETFEDLLQKQPHSGGAMRPLPPLSVDEYVQVSESQLRILKGDGLTQSDSAEPVLPHYDQVHDAYAPHIVDLVI